MGMHSDLVLSKSYGRPMYLQIMEQIKQRVAVGDWPRGEEIPSIRQLAVALSVSVITVKRAYLELEREGVGKEYPHFTLDNVNLELPTGSIMGFIGANGAGKSTTLRILMGLVHQDRGSVHVLGCEMPAQQAEAKRDMGFVSEDMRLYGAATLAWHMDFIRS